jgi:hypothetical protein
LLPSFQCTGFGAVEGDEFVGVGDQVQRLHVVVAGGSRGWSYWSVKTVRRVIELPHGGAAVAARWKRGRGHLGQFLTVDDPAELYRSTADQLTPQDFVARTIRSPTRSSRLTRRPEAY